MPRFQSHRAFGACVQADPADNGDWVEMLRAGQSKGEKFYVDESTFAGAFNFVKQIVVMMFAHLTHITPVETPVAKKLCSAADANCNAKNWPLPCMDSNCTYSADVTNIVRAIAVSIPQLVEICAETQRQLALTSNFSVPQASGRFVNLGEHKSRTMARRGRTGEEKKIEYVLDPDGKVCEVLKQYDRIVYYIYIKFAPDDHDQLLRHYELDKDCEFVVILTRAVMEQAHNYVERGCWDDRLHEAYVAANTKDGKIPPRSACVSVQVVAATEVDTVTYDPLNDKLDGDGYIAVFNLWHDPPHNKPVKNVLYWDKATSKALFAEWKKWVVMAKSEVATALPMRAETDESTNTAHLETSDNSTILVTYDRRGEEVKTTAATFTIERIVSISTFDASDSVSDDMHPIYVIECKRWLRDGPERVLNLEWRNPCFEDLDRYTHMKAFIEIRPTTYKMSADVVKEFGQQCAAMYTVIEMKPQYLIDFLETKCEKPVPQHAIAYFGKQKTGEWVMGNCTWGGDTNVQPVEGSGNVIPHSWLNSSNRRFRIDQDNYPKIVILPYKHLRFHNFRYYVTKVMPTAFRNNFLPALVNLGWCIGTAMHYNEINEVAIVHNYSTEPDSGKTTAQKVTLALTGQLKCHVTHGEVTMAGMFGHMASSQNLVAACDDLSNTDKVKEIMASASRASFNKSTRVVVKHVDKPRQSVNLSSNFELFTGGDGAAPLTRTIRLQFKKLQQDFNAPIRNMTKDVHEEWMKLLTACLPDLILLSDGTGRPATNGVIKTCSEFLSTIAYGNAGDWRREIPSHARVFVTLLQVGYVTGLFDIEEHQMAVFRYMAGLLINTSSILQTNSGLVDQFITRIVDAADNQGNVVNKQPSERLWFHCMRKGLKISQDPNTYCALYVPIVVNVINYTCRLGRGDRPKQFSVREVQQALTERVTRGNDVKGPIPVKMWNEEKLWPPAVTHTVEAYASRNVAIEWDAHLETDVRCIDQTKDKDCFLILQSLLEQPTSEADLTTLDDKIKQSPLYTQVTDGTWVGFQHLHRGATDEHPYAQFKGCYDTRHGLDVQDLTDPFKQSEYFNYEFREHKDLPLCMRESPYTTVDCTSSVSSPQSDKNKPISPIPRDAFDWTMNAQNPDLPTCPATVGQKRRAQEALEQRDEVDEALAEALASSEADDRARAEQLAIRSTYVDEAQLGGDDLVLSMNALPAVHKRSDSPTSDDLEMEHDLGFYN